MKFKIENFREEDRKLIEENLKEFNSEVEKEWRKIFKIGKIPKAELKNDEIVVDIPLMFRITAKKEQIKSSLEAFLNDRGIKVKLV